MLRNIAAIFAGLGAAWGVFFVFQFASHLLSPVPRDLDFNDQEAVRKFMASLSPGSFVLLLAGYAIGSFLAGLVIKKIARDSGFIPPLVIGAVLTIGWIMNIMMRPHPTWVAVAGFFMFIPFALLGYSLLGGSRKAD